MIKISLHNVRIAVIRGKMLRFPFSPKFRKFRLEIKWNGPFRLVPTRMFGITFEGSLISVSRTEMSLSIWRNWCVQYRSFASCLQEQEPNVRWLGSGLCNRNAPFQWARGTFEISKPEYFVEGKAPIVYNNLKMCLSSITINHSSGLVPVQLLPRLSRSVHFGDVSKTLGPRDPKPIGRAIAEN